MTRCGHRRDRSAFTLVEALMAMGIVLILIGLTIPLLRSAKEQGREVKCLSQMRSHGGVLAAFAAEHQDRWPNIFESERSTRLPTMKTVTFDEYGLASGLWHLPVLEAYGEQAFHASLICPSDRYTPEMIGRVADARGVERTEVVGTLRYRLSMAMFYAPELLSMPQPAMAGRFLRTQTQADVMFTSSKCALYEFPFHDERMIDPGMLFSPRRVNVVAADGSGRSIDTSTVTPGIVLQSRGSPEVDEAMADAAKFDTTPDGVRGRDW